MPCEIRAIIWPNPSRVIAASSFSPSPSVRNACAMPDHFPSGKKPVFEITRAPTASGCSHAQRRPIRPPQSWTHERHPLEAEPQPEALDRLDLALPGAGRVRRGVAEAREVRGDGATPRLGQRGDHVPPHERALGKPVHAERREQAGRLGGHGLPVGDPVDGCRLDLGHESGPYRATPRPRRVRHDARYASPRRRLGGVATQRPAKPFTPVRFR